MLLFTVLQHFLASRRNATFLPKVGETGVGKMGVGEQGQTQTQQHLYCR